MNKPEDEASVNANPTFEDEIESSASLPQRTNVGPRWKLDGSVITGSLCSASSFLFR